MSAIDPSNQLVDFVFEILVSFQVISAWYHQLQKRNVTDKLRIFFKEPVECVQLLR